MASKQAVAWVIYNRMHHERNELVVAAIMDLEDAIGMNKGEVWDMPSLEDEHQRGESLRKALREAMEYRREVVEAATLLANLMRYAPFAKLRLLPSLEDKGRFSYSRNPEDADAKRVKTSFGRIIRRQFEVGPEYIKDDTLAKLSEILTKVIWPDLEEVVELKGSAIVQAYSVYTGTSCMSGPDQCEYVRLYANNHDKVSLLAVFEGEWCKAKALLWNCDDGTKMLDRVYTECGCSRYRLSIEAKAQSMGALVGPNMESGQRPDDPKSVIMNIEGLEFGPYMDSFTSAEYVNGKACGEVIRMFTGGYRNRFTTYGMQYTEGWGIRKCSCGISFLSEDGGECPNCGNRLGLNCHHCGESLDGEESTHVDGDHYCEYCAENLFYWCEFCDSFVDRNNLYNVEEDCMCEDCYNNADTSHCEMCDQMVYNENGQNIGDEFYCDHCVRNSFSKCSECGELVKDDELESGICESCLENIEQEVA